MDWGLAKALAPATGGGGGRPFDLDGAPPAGGGRHTGHGSVLGTPGYMAPEQERGEVDALDARSDVYALGAVLYFLLAVKAPPVGGPPPPAAGIPRPLLAVCAKAMATEQRDRYADAVALDAEIVRYLDGRRVEANPESFPQLAARLYARHKVAFWLLVAYLAVRGTVLFFTGR